MPAWLREKLETGGKATTVNRIGRDGRLYQDRSVENEVPGLVPAIARLLEHDPSVARAYLCHPSVQHVSKLPREGGFCGYRNMQMLISYLRGAGTPGGACFAEGEQRLPGVLELQERIETAWDMGCYDVGRVQTGGIKDTRKYVGTPEVAALLGGLGIDFWTASYHDDDPNGVSAVRKLFDCVEQYFSREVGDSKARICKTLLPPMYLQRPGHSLTIIGFEIHENGSRNLLVFDPMYVVSKEMRRLRDGAIRRPKSVGPLLRMYRRGREGLGRYRDFETVEYVTYSTLSFLIALKP